MFSFFLIYVQRVLVFGNVPYFLVSMFKMVSSLISCWGKTLFQQDIDTIMMLLLVKSTSPLGSIYLSAQLYLQEDKTPYSGYIYEQ